MLVIVVSPRLCHPPRRSFVPGGQRIPDFEHPITRRLRLSQDDAPRLTAHSRPELRIEGVDVDVSSLVRAGLDSFELDPGLGQPHPDMGNEIHN